MDIGFATTSNGRAVESGTRCNKDARFCRHLIDRILTHDIGHSVVPNGLLDMTCIYSYHLRPRVVSHTSFHFKLSDVRKEYQVFCKSSNGRIISPDIWSFLLNQVINMNTYSTLNTHYDVSAFSPHVPMFVSSRLQIVVKCEQSKHKVPTIRRMHQQCGTRTRTIQCKYHQ